MNYYYLDPETPGEVGELTDLDASFHPPIATKLQCEFHIWPCDAILEFFPCWITTVLAMKHIQLSRLTGVSFAQVEVTKYGELELLTPYKRLPQFMWMKVEGTPGIDDFGVKKPHKIHGYKKSDYHEYMLVVSGRALDLLRRLGISHATIENYPYFIK